MKKYLIVIIAFFTFCSNDANVATDLSELEKDIAQTEERIEDLESKDSLTLEEEQELENLEEQIEELEEYVEEAEEEELTGLNDPTVAKYFTKNQADPSYNPGKFLPRHCTYEGRYEDIYYERTPVLEIPFKDELILDFYPQSLGLYSDCLLYTSPSPRDLSTSRMPSSA